MKVEVIRTDQGLTRYVLTDDSGILIEPVVRFLRYKDMSGKARNTLKAYCYQLKAYYEFLEQKQKTVFEVTIDDIAGFVNWLRSPVKSVNVLYISGMFPPKRKARTVNMHVSTVLGFYDYLTRHEDYEGQISEKLRRQISGSQRGFKDFLYHINKNRSFSAKAIKLKEPPLFPQTLTKEQILLIMEACHNVRDVFLIHLLWESGMRIGEALSLWICDFEIDECRIHIEDRNELLNLAEIKTVSSPRVIDVSADLMNLYCEYIASIHTDDVDTDHVFIKLSGENMYMPMEYHDVTSLVTRIKRKTSIFFTPHMLRHTSLTTLCRSGWSVEHLQKRAGHANIQSTYTYLHPSDEDLREDWLRTKENMRLNKEGGDSE